MEERKERMKNHGNEDTDENLIWCVMRQTGFSTEQILDLILSLLFAGHGTSSIAISLAIYFLNGRPDVVNKLREEHLKIHNLMKLRGEHDLTWEDNNCMEFTQSV